MAKNLLVLMAWQRKNNMQRKFYQSDLNQKKIKAKSMKQLLSAVFGAALSVSDW
jgi:hypothetical protein